MLCWCRSFDAQGYPTGMRRMLPWDSDITIEASDGGNDVPRDPGGFAGQRH